MFPVVADVNGSLIGLANLLIGFVGGALALTFAYGGYLWMTSHNNPSRRSEAYMYLFGAALGALVVILSPQLATAVKSAIH